MKKKLLAIVLCLSMLLTMGVPGTLAVGTDDASVTGRATGEYSEAVKSKKTATPVRDANGKVTGYKISIDAWTTGEVIHTLVGNPVDIILVLDMSNQMKTGNRLIEMKKAACDFINSSITTNGDRRIALVTYNNTATVRSGSLIDNDAALVPVTAAAAATMNATVNALSGPTGASNIDQGMTKAAHIFQDGNSTVPADRQRIVVLLSAGVFGSGNLMQVEGKNDNERNTIRYNNVADLNVAQHGLWIGNIIKTSRGTNAPLDFGNRYFNSHHDYKNGVLTDWGNAKAKKTFTDFFGTNFSGCGAEMYCIGIGMPKAGLAAYGGFKANYQNSSAFWLNYGILGTMINEVMYRMSSHRPDSTHVGGSQYNDWEQDWKNLMKSNGYSTWPAPHGFWEGHYWDDYTRNVSTNFPNLADKSYFITTDDASKLSGIFDTINQNIGEVSASLATSTVLKDIVTPYFALPEIPLDGTAADVIKVYTMDYNGTNFVESTKTDITEDVTVTMDPSTRSISVTGYNYNDNFITTEGRGTNNSFHGRKLIVEFEIGMLDGFLGGNNVPTNERESGIYIEDDEGGYEKIEDFDVPEVDVETGANVTSKDRINSYFGVDFLQAITLNSLKGTFDVGLGNVKLDLSADNYGLDKDMSNFVTVDTALYVEDPSNPGTYIKTEKLTNVTEDVKYKLMVTVTPKDTDGDCKAVSDEAFGEISVFYPVLTFQDSQAFGYGEKMPGTQELASCWLKDRTVWKNKQDVVAGSTLGDGTKVEMISDVPELDVEMTGPTGMSTLPKTDVPMNAQVTKINGNEGNFDKYVTFQWEKCTPECGKDIKPHFGEAEEAEFYLHPQTCQLTVKKANGETETPHVFDVYRNGEKYTQLSITGNGEETIYELPVGAYTISEKTDWSWRSRNPVYSPVAVNLSVKQKTGELTCTNSFDENKWLNGYSEVIPNVFGLAKKKN